MSVLFGHPSGNPNSHHAALAHFDAGRLEAFCVPWMPSAASLRFLRAVPGVGAASSRIERRRFEPLTHAPLVQGRAGEVCRLIRRRVGGAWDDERTSYEANDWLMRTMLRECKKRHVKAVHAYEDCSLLQFEEAKRRSIACIYDMPIGYFPWWQAKQAELSKRFSDYLPPAGLGQGRYVRPTQKKREMELADLVLVPSAFVEMTIREFYPDLEIVRVPYGVDLEYWCPTAQPKATDELRFTFAGQIGVRKGVPVLLEAWKKAELPNAQLDLVGRWALSAQHRDNVPANVVCHGICSRHELRSHYRHADVFVFPSFFEGFALSQLEAMACGLPVITTEVSDGMNLVNSNNGIIVDSGEVDQLVAALREMSDRRDRLNPMKIAARESVKAFSWNRYRDGVSRAVAKFV